MTLSDPIDAGSNSARRSVVGRRVSPRRCRAAASRPSTRGPGGGPPPGGAGAVDRLPRAGRLAHDPGRAAGRTRCFGHERRRQSMSESISPKELEVESGGMTVLANRPFLLLWLAQLSTGVGGNMVIYGLSIIITASYASR